MEMTISTDTSRADLRRAIEGLSAGRRRAIARAVRDGRAVDDPRNAQLAVLWAQRAQAAWWPKWLLPQKRPHGWRAILWLLHVGWIVVAIALAVVIPTWRSGGVLRWIVVGAFAYSILIMPWVWALVLRTRWNAPDAERRNRELLGENSER